MALERDRDRAESLGTYGLADGAGPDLRGIAAVAARATGMPIAAVGFLVGQRFVLHSSVGMAVNELPRRSALAALVVERAEEVVLPDVAAVTDGRFHGPGGAGVGAFAGVPLVGRDGLAIGALVVADHEPRGIGPEVLDSLRTLAEGVVTRLELGRLDTWGGRRRVDPALGPVRLRRALEEGELVPYFHPVVDLDTGRTRAFEALVRWLHPELGMIAPGRFLPTVEASGLMLPVGRHVLAESLGALAALRRRAPGAADVSVAVNASPLELAHEGYATTVLDELAMQGLRPDALVIEVTETAAFVDERVAVRELTALREAGVEVALDDYGAGHSSALRVLRLPISALKLDRELVCDVDVDPRARAVARSTIAMAGELGLIVVAEGIETSGQRDVLLDLGCGLGQGWLFARPVPEAELTAHVDRARLPRQRAAHGSRRLGWYEDTDGLAAELAAHLLPGLRSGDPVLLAATPALAGSVERALAGTGFAMRNAAPGVLSADRLAEALVRGEQVSRTAFELLVAAPLRRAAEVSGRPVRVGCEVSGLLRLRGRLAAALELEQLWHDLVSEIPVDLYAAYPSALLGTAEGEVLASAVSRP